MVQPYPTAQNFVNSDARMCLQLKLRRRVLRFEIGSAATLILSGLAILLLAVYLVISCYIVFRDEMLARLLNSQAETQYSYEDRIVALRAHLDRVATKQLLNQDSFEDRVNELVARQSQLETRQAILATLAAETQRQTTGQTPGQKKPEPTAKPQPVELSGSTSLGPPAGILTPSQPNASPQPRPLPASEVPQKSSFFAIPSELRLGYPAKPALAFLPEALGNISLGLARIEHHQLASILTLEQGAAQKLRKWRLMITEAGLDTARFQTGKATQEATGGPFLPVASGVTLSAFDQSVLRLQRALREATRLSPALQAMPLGRPVAGEPVITSAFGVRSDPFFHSAAIHSGVDFKGGYGSPVKATAAGKVITANHQGGYGNMVEIDHGFGLTTRYAHLSSIEVDVGDSVISGEIIGNIGSTGRSTGPHLHYETRIDGEASDPLRFLNAAARLARP